MITLEGSSGKGSLWCIVPTFPLVQPSIPAMLGQKNMGITSMAPSECYLPPASGPDIWYVVGFSPFGFKLGRVDIGTLLGVNKSPDTPNPCEHSTIVGGLLYTGTDPTKRFAWIKPSTVKLLGKNWYNSDGAIAQFFQGFAADNVAPKKAFDRSGTIGTFTTSVLNAPIWNVTNYLMTDWIDPISTSTLSYNTGARSDSLISSLPINRDFPVGNYLVKASCVHVSANVWIESVLTEFHQNGSYIPFAPVSKDTGYGYVGSSQKRVRTYTMTHIQNVDGAFFRGAFNIVDEISYWGHTPSSPIAKYYVGNETIKSVYIAPILVLKPGVSVGVTFSKGKLDDYCLKAIPRAMELFKCSHATIARSNAIADVSALESNWLENLSQIRGTTDVVLPLLAGWKAIKRGNLVEGWRALAGAYLSYKYVIAPGISDFKDVRDNIRTITKGFTKYRFSNERRRGKFSIESAVCDSSAIQTYFCTLNLQLKDSSIAVLFNALERLGLDPSSGNAWDLIPLSFVADWFLRIGPTLDRLDAYNNNVLHRNVSSRIETFKVQWPLSKTTLSDFGIADDFSVTKPLKYSWYDRRILSGLGSFDPFAGQKPSDGLSVSQTTQAGALLSSYRR